MNIKERRDRIYKDIVQSDVPLSATTLSSKYHVSRQIIVGDVAILRAQNKSIIATPRGYIIQKNDQKQRYVIACLHRQEDTQDELNIIVDYGGIVEDVIVNHPIYGELKGYLHITSRFDVESFIEACRNAHAKNLSSISDGIHLHTISCESEKQYEIILQKLKEKDYLYQK